MTRHKTPFEVTDKDRRIDEEGEGSKSPYHIATHRPMVKMAQQSMEKAKSRVGGWVAPSVEAETSGVFPPDDLGLGLGQGERLSEAAAGRKEGGRTERDGRG